MAVRREPTLADVAEVAGVSLTTVSRVLNNRGYLSQATKDRVARAVAQLNYRPNQVARALHGKSTNIVGVIVPTVALPFFGELAEEIENALAEHNYRMLVCNSMGRADREREYLDLLVSHRVDGIISGAHNDDLKEYQTVRMPLVTIDRDLSPTIPNVRCANEAAAREATRLLLDRGARRPALLTSRTGRHNRREAGYRAVLEQAGIEPIIFTVDFHTPDAERARLIDTHLDAAADLIDAVFATDDLSAAAVLDWAERRGRQVPRDFKVIGFDGTSAVRRALPGLATVRQPLADLARTAVEVLLTQIRNTAEGQEGEPVVSPIELPGALLPGTTT
ncbi:LacI family DNA-binding transcriptional regulator [Actinomyces sp.]|uniref:LacI family DNA-binding transcriptional regulator n=1 Tax=Actinomyces sp. TaxID=29317 RepID=UPI0026DA9312|nr:LacI family DNA-binding transcriptional regulator [Actinomyces sp.]MDO4899698.1 LacI family DNA-binding transcriptional regulator [Actinomyces sp.]